MTILASLQESATSVILAADAQELYFDKTALMRLFQPATKFDHIELPNGHLAWAWSGGSPPGGDFDEWVHGQTFDSWEALKACIEDEVSRLHLSYAGIEGAEISIIVAAYMEGKIRVLANDEMGGPLTSFKNAYFLGKGASALAIPQWARLTAGGVRASVRELWLLLSGVAAIVPELSGPIRLWRLNENGFRELDLEKEFVFRPQIASLGGEARLHVDQ